MDVFGLNGQIPILISHGRILHLHAESRVRQLGQTLRIIWKFVLASVALSALTFGLVGVNRYFDGVWNGAPGYPEVFTLTGQFEWFVIMLIAVTTGAFILGGLALAFPWAVVKGAELKNLWDIARHKI